MFAAAISQFLRRFLDLFQNLIWYNRDAVDELCIIIYQLKVSRDVQTLSRVSMHMLLLRLYFAIDIGYIEYRNQLDKHRNPERYNLDDRQRRRRRGTLISYSPTEAYGVHTPGIVYVQAPTTATCTRMLTERACPEINLALGDIARGLPAVDRSRDRWIIDRYSEPAGGCSVLLCDSLVQHVCARVYCNVYACGTCWSSQKIAEDTWVMFEPLGNRIDQIHFSISLSNRAPNSVSKEAEKRFSEGETEIHSLLSPVT